MYAGEASQEQHDIPPRLPCGWRCCPCSRQCPAELVGSSMCNPQGCGAGWHLTKHRNMQDQNEGLRGTCNTHKAAGLRLALSKLRIRPWGHAREDHLSSKKCFRCKPLGFECSRPPEGRMPRQIADFYHGIYVQIFTMLFMCVFINIKQITMCPGDYESPQ